MNLLAEYSSGSSDEEDLSSVSSRKEEHHQRTLPDTSSTAVTCNDVSFTR